MTLSIDNNVPRQQVMAMPEAILPGSPEQTAPIQQGDTPLDLPMEALPQVNATPIQPSLDRTLPLRVLTLNCWGLKFISKHRPGRIRAIGRALTAGTADIVALQEVWVEEDYQTLRTLVASRLPYAHRFLSGILGGGLVILSKYPIIESEFRPYSLSGSPTRFYHGDWFVGKGIGRCRILHPELGPLDILNTHVWCTGLLPSSDYYTTQLILPF